MVALLVTLLVIRLARLVDAAVDMDIVEAHRPIAVLPMAVRMAA